MDVVITYVNITDRFKEQYSKYVKKELEENRFRSYDTLELQVKGIRKYLPYIENIFIVVSELEQVQGLDLSDCKIITHDQIIPQKYLPCFNSCTIEMFLHKIPGLNEQFLYFNDDIFVIDNIPSNYWFKDNKPCLCPQICDFNSEDTNIYHKNLYNSTQLIAKDLKFINKYNHKYIKQSHSIRPFLKSTCTKIFNKHIFEIFNTVTRTRHSKNFNMSLFNDYDYLSLNYIPCERNYSYYENDNIDNIINCINKKENPIICINDNEYIYFDEFKEIFINLIKCNLEGKEYKKIINKSKNNINIDFVFPYVTMNDPIWQKEYFKYVPKNGKDIKIGIERFRDFNTLKYLFRSIEQNLPFINNIYMLVMCPSQVPKWLNTKTVKIIYHNQFIDNSILPVFNSSTIEMFLDKIPGLSEYFIYGNDDMFPINLMNKEMFFKNDKLVKYLVKTDIKWYWDILRRKDSELIDKTIEPNKIYRDQHGLTPYRKSFIKKCINKYKNDIKKSYSKFREDYNYNRWIYDIYDLLNNNVLIKKQKVFTKDITYTNLIEKLENNNYDIICINDSNIATNEQINAFLLYLENKFPNKSKYEL